MIILKRKPKVDTRVIDRLVHTYLDYIKSTGEEFTCSEISEIFRYSMCVAQGLETMGYSKRVESVGNGAVNTLKRVLNSEHLTDRGVDFKRGLLEACVYSIESARKRVLEVPACV